ncbi:MAG TPA: BON domain-containing protein [Chloroflexota bacterium]|nr:BON domain-containing protein [Chloroflexota bacterium]
MAKQESVRKNPSLLNQNHTQNSSPRTQTSPAVAPGRLAKAAHLAGANQPQASPVAQTSLEDILQQVRVALSPVPLYGLIVSSDQLGVVYLDGAARTERDYRNAERLAAETPGVNKVVNRLVVDPLTGSMPVRRTVVEPELAAEIELNHFRFARSTEDRLNEMIGTTDTAEATDEAEPYFPPTDPVVKRAPRSAQGIEVVGGFSPTSLDSPIELEQLPRRLKRGDDEIARQVRLALEEDASTSDLPIYVTVRYGIVHLRGTVQSLADAELAEAVASRVPGVIDVREELDVVDV